ncbi:GGDEF domain-containing protein, partial [Escherichia coli]|uniref:GGDEF domain-containing protein n=1 Tax=Escherichia coli TaxID=562 RepID=UPI00112F4080
MLPAIAVLGGQFTDLRDRLRHQKAELSEALARIQELATHDELTGLYNRRQMQVMLEAEWRRCQRTAHGFSVGLVDLDHFKR